MDQGTHTTAHLDLRTAQLNRAWSNLMNLPGQPLTTDEPSIFQTPRPNNDFSRERAQNAKRRLFAMSDDDSDSSDTPASTNTQTAITIPPPFEEPAHDNETSSIHDSGYQESLESTESAGSSNGDSDRDSDEERAEDDTLIANQQRAEPQLLDTNIYRLLQAALVVTYGSLIVAIYYNHSLIYQCEVTDNIFESQPSTNASFGLGSSYSNQTTLPTKCTSDEKEKYESNIEQVREIAKYFIAFCSAGDTIWAGIEAYKEATQATTHQIIFAILQGTIGLAAIIVALAITNNDDKLFVGKTHDTSQIVACLNQLGAEIVCFACTPIVLAWLIRKTHRSKSKARKQLQAPRPAGRQSPPPTSPTSAPASPSRFHLTDATSRNNTPKRPSRTSKVYPDNTEAARSPAI